MGRHRLPSFLTRYQPPFNAHTKCIIIYRSSEWSFFDAITDSLSWVDIFLIHDRFGDEKSTTLEY